MTFFKRIRIAVIAISLAALSVPAQAAVQASLDRTQIAAGDTVQLTLQRDGRGDGQPDLGPLKNDFDVLTTSSGSSVQIVNGQMSAQVQVVVRLSPKHSGAIQIPPLQWDGEQSPPLQLTVVAGAGSNSTGNAAAGAPSHIFISDSLDPPQPYVQGAAILTVRIYTDQTLYQGSLQLEGNPDVAVQQIGKDQQSSETRDGRQYQLVIRTYLLLPQRSGDLKLDGPVLDAQIADASQDPFSGFFGRMPMAGMRGATQPVRVHGDPIHITARPRPAAWTAQDWLPAQNLKLDETDPGDRVHAGEPLTLHLHVKAEGLQDAQLPDLSKHLSLPDGIKIYPDQAKLNTDLQNGKLIASRDQDIALIADRPGRYELPALRVDWWDTVAEQPRVATLPARTIEVLPAANGPSAAPPAVVPDQAISSAPPSAGIKPPGYSIPWPWISLGFALLWLGTVIAWKWQSRLASRSSVRVEPKLPSVAAPRSSDAPAAFQRACKENDAPAARRQLLAWARSVWTEDAPQGLQALSQRLNNPQLSDLLNQLDRACYGGGGGWHGAPLAAALSALKPPMARERKVQALDALYP